MGSPVYNNFQNLITFSRGTNATLFNGAGLLTYAPNNLLTYSQQFENAAWSKNAVTVSADSVVAPDGTTTADTITENSTTDLHVVFATLLSVPTNTAVIFSVYLRANTRNFAMLRIGGGGFTTGPAIKANLTGSGSTSTIEGPVTSSSITAVGGGWYRVSMIFTTISSAPVPNIGPHDNGSSITYAGNGTGSVYAWGAQFEVVTYQTTPSTYVATTASAYYGPRLDYDPVTLALRGLLVEEQRTSAITGVTNFNPVNTTGFTTFGDAAGTLTVVSDTEALTAAGLIGTCTSGTVFKMDNSAGTTPFYARTTNAITLGVSTTWAMSVYARGSGTFTIDVNAGTWTGTTSPALTSSYQRISSVGSSNTSNNQFRLAAAAGAVVYFILMQAEQGAFPTSVIPNTGATSVTRNADNATMSGSQFTPWYNGTQGTYVIQANSLQTPGVLQSFLQDGNLTLATNGAGSLRLFNGSVYTGLTNVSGIGSSTFKAAAGYTEGASASGFSVNGASPVAFTNPGLPPQASFAMGNPFSGTGFGARSINGYIRSITYYPRRLSNTQLQRLTA